MLDYMPICRNVHVTPTFRTLYWHPADTVILLQIRSRLWSAIPLSTFCFIPNVFNLQMTLRHRFVLLNLALCTENWRSVQRALCNDSPLACSGASNGSRVMVSRIMGLYRCAALSGLLWVARVPYRRKAKRDVHNVNGSHSLHIKGVT